MHDIRRKSIPAMGQQPHGFVRPGVMRTLQVASSAKLARFAHDFSRIPVHHTGPALQKQDGANGSAPAEEAVSSVEVQGPADIGIALDDSGSSDSGVLITVQIVSGSKPAPGQQEEEKIYGGLKGGHVVINLGADGVLGFTNDAKGAHFFSRRRSKNSKFEHYTEAQWEEKIKEKQVVTFKIMVTANQRDAVRRDFEGEPTVDYSIAGYRCASYALRALEDAGVIDSSQFSIKYFLAPTPAALVKFLERQGYKPEVQEGSAKRRWNRRFKGASSGPANADSPGGAE
jgi:hypothetical protein